MSTEPPADVVIARTLGAHLRALLAQCALCLLLTLIGAAALQLAGDSVSAGAVGTDPRIRAGLSLLVAAQVMSVVAAVVVGAGWFGTARAAKQGVMAAVTAQPGRTARRLGLLARVTVALAVAGVTVWLLVDATALAGAVVGAILLVQVALLALLVRSRLRA